MTAGDDAKPVTAETVTREQISDLRAWAEQIVDDCKAANHPSVSPDTEYGRSVQARIDAARNRIAAAINARAKGGR